MAQKSGECPQRMLPVAWLAAVILAASIGLSTFYNFPLSIMNHTESFSGIPSSRALLSTTNEALLSGHDCGALSIDDIADTAATTSVGPFMLHETQMGIDSFSHASQCYNGTRLQRVGSCNTFTKPTLPFTSDTNASCPFAEEICESSTGNLLLDSGNLGSDTHLGLNAGPRFTLRHKTPCAPLRTDDYTEIITDSDSGSRFLTYKYGSITHSNNVSESFVYKFDLDKEKPFGDGTSVADYKITYVPHLGNGIARSCAPSLECSYYIRLTKHQCCQRLVVQLDYPA